MSRNVELPFFPQYRAEQDGGLKVTWFEPKFSQCHYNVHNRSNGSNACTLIAILMAVNCHDYRVLVNNPRENLNIRLIHLMAISMLDGNKIHEELKKKNLLKDVNLNVPEALKWTRYGADGGRSGHLVEWKSLIYMERLSRSLCDNVRQNYKEWLKINKEPHDDLYMVLIADTRTVLFLFQSRSDTITLFDSHQHSVEEGACIATATRDQLAQLCFWFKEVARKCFSSDPKLYELTFLYFKPSKR